MKNQHRANLKILFISAANNVHTVRWVNSLADAGHEIHLVFLPNHSPSYHKINKNVTLHALRVGGAVGYYLNALQLRRIFKQVKPDVVNAHYATGYGTLARLARIKPVVLSVWGSDVFSFPKKSSIHKSILKKNLLHADTITSSSICMAGEIQSLFPDENFNLKTIPFGVDVEQFNYQKYSNATKKKQIIIGTVKTLRRNYRIDTVIKAAATLAKDPSITQDYELRFDIYGDGPLRHELQLLIDENNLSKIVTLKGGIPNADVPKVLSGMDIFCVTSEHESFGVAVVEAMLMRLPVVATDVDGFREVLGNDGLLANVGDPEDVADKLRLLITKPELRKQLGKSAQQRAEELYNWKDNVKTMLATYHDVVNRQVR